VQINELGLLKKRSKAKSLNISKFLHQKESIAVEEGGATVFVGPYGRFNLIRREEEEKIQESSISA